MADQSKKPAWRHFQKLRLSRKHIDRRAKRIERTVTKHAHRFVASRLSRLSEVKRQVMTWVSVVMLLVGLSGVQWLLFRESYTAKQSTPGGTYTEGVLGPIETLNPLLARTSAERSTARLLFASLYQYDAAGALKGDLAEKVAVNQSETEYIVTLKSNARWSDGDPLDADDVVFTAGVLRDMAAKASKPAVAGWDKVEVVKLDMARVAFRLSAAYAPFLHTLTFPILPQHVLRGIDSLGLREHAFSKAPTVNSGPFAFRLLQQVTTDGKKKVVHLIANQHYHRGAPRLERFQLYAYPSRDDIARGLKTNEIGATPELSVATVADERRPYATNSYALHNGVYALFNTKSEALRSAAVRRALSQAVDQAALRRQLPRATAELQGPLLSEHISGELPTGLSYNVAAARKALDDDGWKVQGQVRIKNGTPLSLSIVTVKGSEFENAASYIAEAWRKELHVEAAVRVIDPADPTQDVLRTVLQPRQFDVLVYEFMLGGDPDVSPFWHSSNATATGLNFAGYHNATADDALIAGLTKRSPRQRADRYRVFIRRWQADAPALPLYRPMLDYVASPTISSVRQGVKLVTPADRYENVIYWSVKRGSVYKTP
ncbi:MAG: ABC transporter substrate-binding protein [Candidatus Saccharibacteria bacterium]|nr:ABC transporter substrate-binding protein [Candidatus Saccharibacteria bacterium]